jgi:hypothetical protein
MVRIMFHGKEIFKHSHLWKGRAVSHDGPTKFWKGFARAPRGVFHRTVKSRVPLHYFPIRKD